MAGIAAALGAPGALDALAAALQPRGEELVECRLPQGLEICVRAVMPAIPRVVDAPTGDVIAAFAIDGIASATALDLAYNDRGPAGLVDGETPYAVILADAEHEALVLARNGDGPGLYYAAYGPGWLAGSEPGALVQAGVAANPDPAAVRRFVEEGACDRDERTLFARIDRVLPGEVVMLVGGRAPVRFRPAVSTSSPSVSAERALADALSSGTATTIGLLVPPGRPGGALIGAALEQPDRALPLEVHAVGGPRVLASLAEGVVRVNEHWLDFDLDRMLTELGEPVADLGLYQAWAVGRSLQTGTDVLVDASTGDRASVARISDRLEARYGVTLRCPLRLAGLRSEAQLESLVAAKLPPSVANRVEQDPACVATAAEVLLAQRDEVAGALGVARPWRDHESDVADLRRLQDGADVDADALLRAYQVERWLRIFGGDEVAPAPASAAPPPSSPPPAPEGWARVAVRTAIVEPGSSVSEVAAWYAVAAVEELAASVPYRESFTGPWFAVLSGKAVAVAQDRLRPLWEIQPGLGARILARLARPRYPHLSHRWTMQVAIEESGVVPVAMGVLLGRLMPATAAGLYAPRPTAVAPADSAVVGTPVLPEDAARSMMEVMGRMLPAPVVRTLAGVAVASVDPAGVRLLAFVDGPNAAAVPAPRLLLRDLLGDDPAEQGGPHTPVVLVFGAPLLPNDQAATAATPTTARDPRDLGVAATR